NKGCGGRQSFEPIADPKSCLARPQGNVFDEFHFLAGDVSRSLHAAMDEVTFPFHLKRKWLANEAGDFVAVAFLDLVARSAFAPEVIEQTGARPTIVSQKPL